jgi:His-Xaa-Ser system protein HxsD
MPANKKKCVLEVDDRLFCSEAILKASYMFIDDYFIVPSYKNDHAISIAIEAKEDASTEGIDKLFGNELIAQMVRYNLSKSNKIMKELILVRALYSTCLDTAEPAAFRDEQVSINYSLDDIAVNWFDVYEEA